MYQRFFELRERPFDERLDTHVYFATPDREEALAAMEYAAKYAAAHVLIVGEAGQGKTMLVRVLVSRLGPAERVLILTPTELEGSNLVWEICRRLDIGASAGTAAPRLLPRLKRQLSRAHQDGQRTLLIIDQAERLSAEQWLQIEQLTELQSGEEPMLSMVLLGQPPILQWLGQPRFARLRQLFFQELSINMLSPEQWHGYVVRRLEVAGAVSKALFDECAVRILHAASGGVPRMINQIADSALLAAYGAGKPRVDAAIANEVTQRAPEVAPLILSNPPPPGEVGVDTNIGPSRNTECSEPFDLSVAKARSTPAILFPPWDLYAEREERVVGGGPTEDVEEEMVSIACAAAGSMTRIPLADFAATTPFMDEAVPPQELLQRLEKAVGLFDAATRCGQDRRAAMDVPDVNPEMESPALTAYESRLRAVVASAETRLEELERRANRLAQPLAQMEERRALVERACAAAQQVEARLAGYAERIAQAAGEVQERSNTLVLDMESREGAQRRLQILTDQAAAAVTDLEARFELNQQKERDAAERLEDLRRSLALGIREASDARAAMDELIVQASTDHALAASKSETLRAEIQKCSDRAEEVVLRQRTEAERDLIQHLEHVVSTFKVRQQEALGAEAVEWERRLAARQAQEQKETETLHDREEQWTQFLESTQQRAGTALVRRLAEVTSEWDRRFIEEQQRHDGMIHSTKAALAELDAQSHEMVTGTRETVSSMQRALESQAAKWKQQLAERQAQEQGERETLRDREENWTQFLESTQQRAGTALVRRLAEVTSEWDRRFIEEQQRHDGIIHSTKAALAELDAESHERIAATRETVSSMQEEHRITCEKMRNDRDQMRSDMETWRVQRIVEQESLVHRMTGEMEAMRHQGEAIRGQIVDVTARFAEVREHLQDATRQSETVAQSATDVKNEMNGLERKSGALCDRLGETIRDGEKMLRAVQSACGEVESLHRAGGQMLVEIGAHCERAQGLREPLARGEEIVHRLGALLAEASPVLKQMPDQIEGARKHGDVLSRLNMEALERTSRFDSHHAAAASTARQLSDATIAAHDVIKELRQTSDTMREAGEQSRLDGTALSGRLEAQMACAQDSVQRLAVEREGGVEVVRQLEALRGHLSNEAAALTASAEQAERTLTTMREQTNAAEVAVDRISVLGSTLESAEQAAAELKAAALDLRQLHETLCADGEAAVENQTRLAQWCATAEELSSAGEALEQRLHLTMQNLTTTIKTVSEATVQQEESLKDQLARSTRLAGTLQTLEAQVGRVESEMNQFLNRPVEVLRTAQDQTKQLEGVCAAVRKVFGNLAQTSLQARNDIQAFEERSAEAAQRSAHLADETNRAAMTLQQWVEEAIRVQARLEQTLQRSPSVAQTHPGAVLKSVSRLAKPIAGPVRNATLVPEMTSQRHEAMNVHVATPAAEK